jgi:uncharacterized protein (DUF305 family)
VWFAAAFPAMITAVVTAMALAVVATRLPAQGATAASRNYTQADVHFMQDMIIHHAQAVVMSDWAATHGAAPALRILCKRIALSQNDEIKLMQRWLLEHHLPAPDPLGMLSPPRGPMHDTSPINMPGMDMGQHPMVMAGMLTPEQMRQLDAARDTTFDRLYLTGMIRHHQGALAMVADLFATPGGGQQAEISGFATDIDAGQRAEIARMQLMLNSLNGSHTS